MNKAHFIPGMVLAGGRSTRMGEDKTLKRLAGKPLALHAAKRLAMQTGPVFINTRTEALAGHGYELIGDAFESVEGPLSGILAGLEYLAENLPRATHLAVVAADTPFFPETLVDRLAAAVSGTNKIAMAAYCGDPEPVFGLWPVSLAGALRQWLETSPRRSIRVFAEMHDVALVDFVDGPATSFFNVNTPGDFERARTLMNPGPEPKVLGISGWKNSGKTGLAVRLVAELTARGYRVSTVKHAHHDFDIDKPGADSFRHREAGAHEVAIVSGARYAVMHELRGATEPTLQDILGRLGTCDIVIVEGYKREAVAKIELRRLEAKSREPLAPDDPYIVAIAADHPTDGGSLPVFDINDTRAIADFAEVVTGLRR